MKALENLERADPKPELRACSMLSTDMQQLRVLNLARSEPIIALKELKTRLS